MCGGKKEVFDKYTDLLKAMGSSVVYVGEIGSGNVAKLANQMVVAANIGICAEAMTFAKKMGTRTGISGHPWRPCWFYCYGRKGAYDVSWKLQAWIQN